MPISPRERSRPAILVSEDGQKVGRVLAYHVQRATGLSVFAQVELESGQGQVVVPVLHGEITGAELRVPYPGSAIADAPHVRVVARLRTDSLLATIEYFNLKDEIQAAEPSEDPPGPKPIPIPLPGAPIIIPAFVRLMGDEEGMTTDVDADK